jgi:hypothetical protein
MSCDLMMMQMMLSNSASRLVLAGSTTEPQSVTSKVGGHRFGLTLTDSFIKRDEDIN